MSFLNRGVFPGQRSNSPLASNCEIELQENRPTEVEDKLFLTIKKAKATIDGQEQLNAISNGNMSNGSGLLQTDDEKSDASQGQRLYRVALLAMCFLSAVSLGLADVVWCTSHWFTPMYLLWRNRYLLTQKMFYCKF